MTTTITKTSFGAAQPSAVPAGLEVTAGASFCQIDANGCATDGAGEHGNDEACTIQVNAAGYLTATEFDTESGYDFVTIGGTPYQGGIGPHGVAASAGSAFQWQSDGSVTNAGWTICLGETRPQPQSVPCDLTGATLDSFNRPSHVCLVRGWWRHAPMGGPWRCRSQSTRVHVHALRTRNLCGAHRVCVGYLHRISGKTTIPQTQLLPQTQLPRPPAAGTAVRRPRRSPILHAGTTPASRRSHPGC